MNLNLVEKDLRETFMGEGCRFSRAEFAVLDFTIGNLSGWVTQNFDDEFNKTTVDVQFYDRHTHKTKFESSEKDLNLEQLKNEIRKHLR